MRAKSHCRSRACAGDGTCHVAFNEFRSDTTRLGHRGSGLFDLAQPDVVRGEENVQRG